MQYVVRPGTKTAPVRRRCTGFVLAVLLCFAWAPAATWAADRIDVAAAELVPPPEGNGRGKNNGNGESPGYELNAQFNFDLPAVLEDAVNRGIALYFVVDFELYRNRWYWFDKKLVETSLTYRLTYSPLTRQYRLARGALAQPFDSIGEALATLRRVRAWRVIEPQVLDKDVTYSARVRMRLDTSQLPRLFQINALTNRDWTLASDWRNVELSLDSAK
jgi:hypothetical protein